MSQDKRQLREAQRATREEDMVKLRGTSQGRKWARSLWLGVPFLIITLAFAALAALYLMYADRGPGPADTTAASAQLRLAVAAADSYAAEHSGSYAAMATADLKSIEPNINWVMGTPNAGEVGIMETGAATFKLVFKDSTSSVFQVVRDEQGRLTFTTESGTPF